MIGIPPTAPTGVVLAGGRSRRMGEDKARLVAGGETLAAGAARRLAAVCGEVVVADGGRGLLPDLASVADGPGAGPAAGILGAAAARPDRALLVLACDLPAVPEALLAVLAEPARGADWALPRWQGRLEPLCALYGPAALAALSRQVAGGELAPHRLGGAPELAIRYLEGEALARFGDPRRLFSNLNTRRDLAAFRRG